MIDENIHLKAFVALQAMRANCDTTEPSVPCLSASQIIAYARRKDATVDLQIERVLRSSRGKRELYFAALRGGVRASSISVAAAADRVTERWVGAWRLEILEENDDFQWLVVRTPEEGPEITMIELRRPDGSGRRFNLGSPIDQVFQLPLDPAFAELADLVEWLQDPSTEIHLI